VFINVPTQKPSSQLQNQHPDTNTRYTHAYRHACIRTCIHI